jgi:transposase
MARWSLGVDIAKESLVAALWQGEAGRRLGEFPNNPEGFAQLRLACEQASERSAGSELHLVLEPTAGYELPLALFGVEQGWQVSRPNPKQGRDWAKGLGQRAKTDREDALVVARYGAERKPPRWLPLASEISELESLLTRQRELQQMLEQERRRQEAFTGRPGIAPQVPRNVQRVIAGLEATLAEVQTAIDAHRKQHRHLKAPVKQWRTVPGVGAKSVLPLLVLLHRWHTLTGGEGATQGLVAFAGLDPTTHESGSSGRGSRRISRQGNRQIRPRLYRAALGGVKGDNVLREFYQRLVGRGKRKKGALVAAARKILVWAWAVFRDHGDFQPSLGQAKPQTTA